jgi:putative glutathione S-transferase
VGKLVDGKWLNDEQLLTIEQQQYKEANGRFQRGTSVFRNWITSDGSAGFSGEAGFKAEANRYHFLPHLIAHGRIERLFTVRLRNSTLLSGCHW